MINGYLIGDEELLAHLTAANPDVNRQLLMAVTRLATQLQRHVMQDKLSGQVLHVRTGTLRRSINQRIQQDGDLTEGAVGTNVKYGHAWEYGFDAKVGAGAHGGPRNLQGRARDTYFARHPPGTRHYAARSFLRSAITDMEAQIKAGMETAVMKAVKI